MHALHHNTTDEGKIQQCKETCTSTSAGRTPEPNHDWTLTLPIKESEPQTYLVSSRWLSKHCRGSDHYPATMKQHKASCSDEPADAGSVSVTLALPTWSNWNEPVPSDEVSADGGRRCKSVTKPLPSWNVRQNNCTPHKGFIIMSVLSRHLANSKTITICLCLSRPVLSL